MLKITAWIDSLPKLAKKRHRNVFLGTENCAKRKSSRHSATKSAPTGIQFDSTVRDSNWAYEPMVKNSGKNSCKISVENSCKISVKKSAQRNFLEEISEPCSESGFASLPNQNRPKIRTNPWVKPKPPMTLGWNSVGIRGCAEKSENSSAKLEESTCSSGYGSQDSSPESSVHSPDWSFTLSTESPLDNSVNSPLGKAVNSPLDNSTNSPLDKAVNCCFTKEIGVGCDEDAIDRDFENLSEAPPVMLEAPEAPPVDILAELSLKLDELRRKRQKVNEAVTNVRTEKNRRIKERQICQEQLQRIRQMRWVVHGSDFEV